MTFTFTGETFDSGDVAVYKFTTPIENNNEEINAKWYKVTRSAKENQEKFRIKQQNERASIFMQFLILFNRNFKASIRNTVGFLEEN